MENQPTLDIFENIPFGFLLLKSLWKLFWEVNKIFFTKRAWKSNLRVFPPKRSQVWIPQSAKIPNPGVVGGLSGRWLQVLGISRGTRKLAVSLDLSQASFDDTCWFHSGSLSALHNCLSMPFLKANEGTCLELKWDNFITLGIMNWYIIYHKKRREKKKKRCRESGGGKEYTSSMKEGTQSSLEHSPCWITQLETCWLMG